MKTTELLKNNFLKIAHGGSLIHTQDTVSGGLVLIKLSKMLCPGLPRQSICIVMGFYVAHQVGFLFLEVMH